MSIIGRRFLIIDKNGQIAVHFCHIIDNRINIATIQERELIINLFLNFYKKGSND